MDYSLIQAMGLYDFRAEFIGMEWLDVLNILTPFKPSQRRTILVRCTSLLPLVQPLMCRFWP
jgi:hypothetical protein